jgi:enamine deaminase RidA (YjgF/YER057c/UK114 family)
LSTRAEIINPPGWKRPKGYSNAVVLPPGRALFLAGIVGWNAAEQFTSDNFAAQFRQALVNVKTCVEAAGSSVNCIGRMTVYVVDKREYMSALGEIGAAWREVMGAHYPAMALVEVKALLEPRAKVEIEATGVVPDEGEA